MEDKKAHWENWLSNHLSGDIPADGETIQVGDRRIQRDGRILRDSETVADAGQAQTQATFAYKWQKTDTYDSHAMRQAMADWFDVRVGDVLRGLPDDRPLSVLDVGCGSGYSASILFEDLWDRLYYVGTDISRAIDVAPKQLERAGDRAALVQADLMDLPFRPQTFDLVMSEGVLHHTPSTRNAIHASAKFVRPGGRYSIYVYAKKSPIREFTDDYIRDLLVPMSSEQAWEELMPLSKLGAALGELDVEVDVPENVRLLGIPAGKINIQRLFYWHVCKMYHRPDFSLVEMNHINFDWFTPRYAHRQTPEETKAWVEETGLIVDRVHAEEAGQTVQAYRPD